MKNRLKGVTLLETVIYLGLFSLVIVMVLSFMLSTTESTTRTMRKSILHQSMEFVIGHIDDTLSKSNLISTTNSVFDDTNGILEINISGEAKQYTLVDSRIYYDGVPITPTSVVVENFELHPSTNGNGDVIGITVISTLRSVKDNSLTENINLLFTLR